MNLAFLLGRTLIGGFFLSSGVKHLLSESRSSMSGYAAAKDIPLPELAVIGSGVAMVLGGASILTGVKPHVGAAALAGVLGVITPTMHDFWNAPSETRPNEVIQFSKNAALLGAALVLFSIEEPWPGSVLSQSGERK